MCGLALLAHSSVDEKAKCEQDNCIMLCLFCSSSAVGCRPVAYVYGTYAEL